MKAVTLFFTLAISASIAHADDFSFAFEGNAGQRAHLKDLQGGTAAAALQVTDWTGAEPMELDDLKGRIVVLDFWATWCGPCIRSIPHTNALRKKYEKDVVFIGICHPRGSEKMATVVKEHGIEYPVAIDRDGKTGAAYAVNSYPDYYIIGRDGTLVVADCANDKVEAVLKRLLSSQE